MEKLVNKIPSKYSQLDSENTGGSLSYYLYELIQENCFKINKTFKLRESKPSDNIIKKYYWKLNIGVYFCLLLFHSLHNKYINENNIKDEENIYKKLNVKKEQKYLTYLLKYNKKEFLENFKEYIINMPQIEICIDEFFSQLENTINDNEFIDNIKKIFKEKKNEKKFLGMKREEKEKENENNIIVINSNENIKIKKITDFFNIITNPKKENEISLEENEKEGDNVIDLNNDNSNSNSNNYKRGFLLFPDKNYFQKRYNKIITLNKNRIRHKSKSKKPNKEKDKEIEIIKEGTKQNINNNIKNNIKNNNINNASSNVQKDFKGIKSLIESKIINFDNKNNKNKSSNINNINNINNNKITTPLTNSKNSQINLNLSQNNQKQENCINNNNISNNTFNYNNSYTNLSDKQFSYMTDLSFSRNISSGINSRLEKMPLIKTAKKGKKREIGGKKILKAIEKRNEFIKTKEKNLDKNCHNIFGNYIKTNNIIDINHRIKSKKNVNNDQQNILKYIVNENFYGNQDDINIKKNEVNNVINISEVNNTDSSEEKNLKENLNINEDVILIPKTPERENELNEDNKDEYSENNIETKDIRDNLDMINVKANYSFLMRQKA